MPPQLPRGIAPELLLSQVKNTMPYLFAPETKGTALTELLPAQVILAHAADPSRELSHFEYFKLCLSAHFLTVGTPVPTDVDNQIRQKLWPRNLPLEDALQMVDLVSESRRWNYTAVTTRFVAGAAGTPWQNELIAGHLGEWFTVASGAYCALKQYRSSEAQAKRQKLFDEIADEVRRHSEIFGSLWRAHDGVGCLKAASSIAHNFGDLDRVMDMWELAVDDPLRLEFYKLATQPFDSNRKLRHLGRLWVAGELYKAPIEGSALALENHRHFALRKPRSLRQSPELLIPTGPFFDDWGRKVVRLVADPSEVADALLQGWEKMPKTVGYGRAMRSLLEAHPELTPQDIKKNHKQRAVLETTQERFEKKWNDEALRHMDEIPSRA